MPRPIFQIFAIISALILPLKLNAEIIKTGPTVFQTTDQRGKIVLSHDEPGIFIAYGEPIDVQLFDPALLRSDSTSHVFLRYDQALNGYVKGTFGKTKSYRIVGSLTFLIGNLRVAVDNTNGYLSIAEAQGPEDSIGIIGIRGLDVVARYKGPAAQALLEANQLSPYRGVVKNFSFINGELTLDGKPVQTSAIGLTLDPPKNDCLSRTAHVYLRNKELVKIKQAADENQRIKIIDALMKQQKKSNPLDALLIVKATSDSIFALDYEQGKMVIIKSASQDPENQICLIEDLAL